MPDDVKDVLARILDDAEFRAQFEADRRKVLTAFPFLSEKQRVGLMDLSVDSFVNSASSLGPEGKRRFVAFV
jgi:hypothetical protein